MNQDIRFLPDETYDFFGRKLFIRSNSMEILDDLRLVYARFINREPVGDTEGTEKIVVEIIDEINQNGELKVSGPHESYNIKCLSLNEFDHSYYTTPGSIPDPVTFWRWFVLESVCKTVKNVFLFHGGAMSWNGQGIIFLGDSGMGKTTLTLKLAQHGFNFLSDEAACLNPETIMVETFLRRLNLSEKSRILLDLPQWPETAVRPLGPEETEWTMDIDEIFPGRIGEPCSLKYIVFLHGFGEEARLEYLANSYALFRLFRYALSPIDNKPALMFRFAPLIDSVICYNLISGAPEENVEVLKKMLQDAPDDPVKP